MHRAQNKGEYIVSKLFGILCFLIGLSCNTYAASTQKDIESAIQKQAEHLLLDNRFTSVSIGVVSDGKSVTRHYGELTKRQGNKPNDQTIYEIGSVSKTMVGLLTAYAIADGKLSLNGNINDYIDNQLNKVSTASQPITIQELLTHTSGLPKDLEHLGLTEETVNKNSFIKAINKFDASILKGQFHYSGVGTELLSYILTQVYHKPFDKLLKQTLRDRAGMSNTQVNLSKTQMPFFAHGYNDKNEVARSHVEPNKLWGGSGFVKSTMTDLMSYMKLQLQSESPAIALSHKRLFDVNDTEYLAFFWIVAKGEKIGTYLIHHGGMEGTQNWMIIFPTHNLAISVVSNSSFPETQGLLRDVGMNIASSLLTN
jgi:CubicO group peptidase (beta-lactamase class C family)